MTKRGAYIDCFGIVYREERHQQNLMISSFDKNTRQLSSPSVHQLSLSKLRPETTEGSSLSKPGKLISDVLCLYFMKTLFMRRNIHLLFWSLNDR